MVYRKDNPYSSPMDFPIKSMSFYALSKEYETRRMVVRPPKKVSSIAGVLATSLLDAQERSLLTFMSLMVMKEPVGVESKIHSPSEPI